MSILKPEQSEIKRGSRLAFLLVLCLPFGTGMASQDQDLQVSAGEMWTTRIQPLLDRHCNKCHGGVKQKGGLNLSSYHRLLEGGDNGPVVNTESPLSSALHRVLLENADPHMPPKKQLTQEEIADVLEWISLLSEGELDSVPDSRVLSVKRNSIPENALGEQSINWIPDQDLDPEEVINQFIGKRWERKNIKPAPMVDDRDFARRVYLDLIGRIPSKRELEVFLFDGGPNKRPRLVDQLLSHEGYARHLREVFDVVLMGRADSGKADQRRRNHWNQFLEQSFLEDRPWNEVVHRMITARVKDGKDRGSFWFLYERRNDHQSMAEAIAPVAYGTQIKCAQCHDHPLAEEIGQRHYWGLVSAFNRSSNIETAVGPGVAESAIGGFIKFTNLEKESQPARLALLNGKTIEESWPQDNEKQVDQDDLYHIPPPKKKKKAKAPAYPLFSRREATAEALTEGNDLLAKAMVNRIWALLLGRGLVHPVDEMNSRYPPSHPGLLQWLAQDFSEKGYRVRPLVRAIVLSRPYQLSSRTVPGNRDLPEDFAFGLEKPLIAEVLWRSFWTVMKPGEENRNPEKDERFMEMKRALIRYFPDTFPVDYNATLQQTMFLSNSPVFNALLEPEEGNLSNELLKITDPDSQVEQVFLATLGRLPESNEKDYSVAFLGKRSDRSRAGIKQLLWTLLTSTEFLVNH